MTLFQKPTKIAAKITRIILIIELFIFVFSVIISYVLLHPAQLKKAVSSASVSNNEIATQINTTLVNLTNSSSYFISSKELQTALANYHAAHDDMSLNRLRLTISNLTDSMTYVAGVTVDVEEDFSISSITAPTDQDIRFFDIPLYEEIKSTPNMSGYSSIYQISENPATYHMAYCTNRFIGVRNYTFTIFYNVTSLVNSIHTLSDSVTDGCILTDYAGNIFYQSGDYKNILENCQDSLAWSQYDTLQTDSGYYFFTTVSSSSWNMISYLTNRSINQEFYNTFLILLVSYIILCLVTILLMTPSVRRIVAPIRSLNQSMQKVSAGDFSVHSEVDSNDEIGELSNVFNMMVDSLNQHINEIIEHERTEEKMKYNLMITQIDSHFIYNTMSIINALARKNKNEDVIEINSALIKILQNNLRVRTTDITDTVEQEIDLVKQYWIIENMRYDNHAELFWEVDEALYQELIPKNLLQPIVENCLFHGLVNEETGSIEGEIHLSMKKTDTAFIIKISDNGRGIPEETLHFLNNPGDLASQMVERGKHIGLSNIRQRLEYIYKGKASMKIENQGGTTVTIILPFHS